MLANMNSIKTLILFQIILTLNLVHSKTDLDEQTNDRRLLNQGAGIGVESAANLPFVTLSKPPKIVLMMEADLTVTLNYTISCKDQEETYIIRARSDNRDKFVVQGNATFEVSCKNAEFLDTYDNNNFGKAEREIRAINYTSELAAHGSIELELHGILIGFARLEVKVESKDSDIGTDVKESINSTDMKESIKSTEVTERTFTVSVLRIMRPIDTAFQVIVGCVIFLIIIGFGCGLNLEVVKECLKKPIAPGIGLGCQYILMPLTGFAVAKLVPIDNQAITFGIFVCGVCPGGGASNIYTYLLGGDVNLSITMTLISNVAALGMMPFWIYTLGRQFVEEDFKVQIPYLNMLQTLAMLTVPLVIGVFIKYKFPKFAVKFIKILKPVTIIVMLTIVVVGIYSNLFIFQLFRPEYFLAGGLLPYCGYIFGGIVAAICRQPWTRVKTISLETGMQNIGVALFLLITSFPPPLGDLAALAPMSSAVTTPLPPLLISIPYLLHKRCTRKYDQVTEMVDEKIEVVENGDNKSDAKNEESKKFLDNEKAPV